MFKIINRDRVPDTIYCSTDLFEAIHEYLSIILEKLNFLHKVSKQKQSIDIISKSFSGFFVIEMENYGASKSFSVINRTIRFNFDKGEFNAFIEKDVMENHVIGGIIESINRKLKELSTRQIVEKPKETPEEPKETPEKPKEIPEKPKESPEELREKDKQNEKLNIFNSDKESYKMIKEDLASGKISEVPELFSQKYEVFEVMEEEGVLGADNEFDVFIELFEEVKDDEPIDEPYVPHNVNYPRE